MFKIYKILNKCNYKKYIGMTCSSLNKRFLEHCSDKKMYLSKCINREGKENFEISEIDSFQSKEEALYFERYYIMLNDSLFPSGYNLALSGDGLSFIRSKLSGKQLELI